MPNISVIVPVYNTEKYLHRCIDSILAQTYTDFELLLINDGSKDNSGKICDEYATKDSRIKVFHKENGGVSSARNVGLDNAKGEWITFCDADDWVCNKWLEVFFQYSEGVDLVVQGFNNTDLQEKSLFSFKGNIQEGLSLLLNRCVVGYTVLKCFRTSIITDKKISFNEDIVFREDEEFVLRYFCCINNICCVDKGEYNYIIPNLQKKYIHIDNFMVSLSMYKSAMKIYHGELNNVTKAYLLGLINAYFYSFYNGNINNIERTTLIKNIVGNKILAVEEISKISRIILYYFPSYLVNCIFKLKALIRK